MILDVNQKHHAVEISYLDANGNKQIYKLPVDQYMTWQVVPRGTGEPGYRDIRGGDARRFPARKYNRFELLQRLHELPQEVQDELFAYRQANLVACDIETEIGKKFAKPDTAEMPVNCISAVDTHMNIALYTTKVAHGDIFIVDREAAQPFYPKTEEEAQQLEAQGVTVRRTTVQQEIFDIVYKHINKLITPEEAKNLKINIFEFSTEKEMLQSFFSNVVKYAAVLTFWNGFGYDQPYLLNRLAQNGLDASIGSITGDISHYTGCPKHTVFTDYMVLTKEHGKTIKNIESLKLDYISNRVLGVGKLPYRGELKDLEKNDIPGFLAYNIIDSVMVQLIHRVKNFMAALYGFSSACKLELTKADSQVAQTESLISLDTLNQIKMPDGRPMSKPATDYTLVAAWDPNKPPQYKYPGGHVKQPHKHLARRCACIDFSGLYPSVMRSCNISIDNYRGSIAQFPPDIQKRILEEVKYFVSVNGNVYMNDHDYCCKRIQVYLRAKRDEHKAIAEQGLEHRQPWIEKALYERGLWKEPPRTDANVTSMPWEIEAGGQIYKIDLCNLNEKKEDGTYVHEDLFLWHCFHTNLRISFFHFDMQIAFKLVANSLYGASANVANTFGNTHVANDITAEGRNSIQCAEMLINNWMNFEWHKDVNAHKWFLEHFPGQFTILNEQNAGHLPRLETRDRIMYIDTDSLYVEYDDLLESTGFTGDPVDFFGDFYRLYFGKIVVGALASMINGRHGQSMMKFDLEYITEQAVFAAKKMYLFTMAAEGERKYDQPVNHIKTKGMATARSFMSVKCRDMCNDGVRALLTGQVKTKQDYLAWVTKSWQEFQTWSVEDISKRISILDAQYRKYIVQDQDAVEWRSRTLPQYRGAAFYNYHLHQKGLDDTIEPITDGFVCNYADIYGTDFSFRIYELPDWAPKANYAMQFVKIVVNAVNKVACHYGVVTDISHLFKDYVLGDTSDDQEDEE